MITMKRTETNISQIKNHTHHKNQMNQGSDNFATEMKIIDN